MTTSLRRDPVVDCLSLLLQWQRFEILWHKRSRCGGCCTHGIILATPKPRVRLPPRHPRCVAQRANGDLGTHVQLGCQVSSCGISFAKLCCTLPDASHLTRLWPGIINPHLALLFQESDSRLSAVSEVLAKRLFVLHWVEWCSSGDTVYSHPSSFSFFPVVSRFITGFFSPVHPFHAGIQCRCCQLLVLGGLMLKRSTNVFCSVRNCHMWPGRLHIRQN